MLLIIVFTIPTRKYWVFLGIVKHQINKWYITMLTEMSWHLITFYLNKQEQKHTAILASTTANSNYIGQREHGSIRATLVRGSWRFSNLEDRIVHLFHACSDMLIVLNAGVLQVLYACSGDSNMLNTCCFHKHLNFVRHFSHELSNSSSRNWQFMWKVSHIDPTIRRSDKASMRLVTGIVNL